MAKCKKKCIFQHFGTKFHHQRSPDPQFVGTIDIFLTLPLATIEEAGMNYEALVQISIEIDILLLMDLSELEREAMIEIKGNVEEKLETIVEVNFEQQLDNEMEACAYHFNHENLPHINQNEEEEEEEEEEEVEEEVEEVDWEEREE